MTEKRPQNCGTRYCSCIECPYETEQAEQEPVAWPYTRKGIYDKLTWIQVRFENEGAITALREALEHPEQDWPSGGESEQAEQEPVAWPYTRKGIYDKLTELGASITQSCCNVPDKRCGADEWILQTVQIELLLDALSAPVRTKDLTDDEIAKAIGLDDLDLVTIGELEAARAVIAADRRKNK